MKHQEVSARGSLKVLHQFIDQEGLFRTGGRLQQSALAYQTMHQILPSNNNFTKLVVSAEKSSLLHAGPKLLIASLRERYFITRIRNLAKTNSSVPNLLQVQGAGFTTAHG